MKYISTTIILVLGAISTLAQNGGPMTSLDKALQAAQRDQSKANDFYNLFLNTDVYIPTQDTSDGQSAERRAGDNEKFTPVILIHGEKRFLPVFDTLERLQAWAKRPINFVRLPAHALLQGIDGSIHIVLNLGTDHFKQFAADEIKELQNVVRRTNPKAQKAPAGTQVLVGAPAKTPEGLEEALKACLGKSKEVKAAYLGQIMVMSEGEKPHLVLLLDVEAVADSVFSAIMKDVGVAIKGLLKEGEYLDMIRNNGQGLAASIVKRVKPFYIQSN